LFVKEVFVNISLADNQSGSNFILTPYRNDSNQIDGAEAMGNIARQQKVIPTERFFQKLPVLAITGDEQSVDRIAYELLNLLMDSAGANTGQISLLPRGGRVEKVCIIKDGKPWLWADLGLHLYNPSKGFTGEVIRRGRTILVKDIWAKTYEGGANPFLEICDSMESRYLEDIKKPVSSTLILPIKRNNEIFCTIELGRYRGRQPFTKDDQQPLDAFSSQYGPLIINYLLDTKNRIALNIAYEKLNNLSRFIASTGKIDYCEAVTAYQTLSSADLGFAFFRRGEGHSLYLVAWRGEDLREIYFSEFCPSVDSVLCDNSDISFPIEGTGQHRRLLRFRSRLLDCQGINKNDLQFLLNIIDSIRSYVVYPLHMLNQDLGVINLASSRNDFCRYLHMSPFLSLYNSLLRSFLLNERVAGQLSQISLKIHNPGFYCLGGIKTALAVENPKLLTNPKISAGLNCLDNLLSEIHEQGKVLKCRPRHIHFRKWLSAWIEQKRAHQPGVTIMFQAQDMPQGAQVFANYEHLETLFENLFANSLRAINARQSEERLNESKINLTVTAKENNLLVRFQDNGQPYKTVSGRGVPQIESIMQELGGSFSRETQPYAVTLTFPYHITEDKEAHDED